MELHSKEIKFGYSAQFNSNLLAFNLYIDSNIIEEMFDSLEEFETCLRNQIDAIKKNYKEAYDSLKSLS